MNTTQGLLSVLAVGFAALLFGGFVAASDIGLRLESPTVSGILGAEGKGSPSLKILSSSDTIVALDARGVARTRISNLVEIQDVTRARMGELDESQRIRFRSSIADVRLAIAEYKKDMSRDDFKGFSVKRLLGASGLSDEEKRDLYVTYLAVKSSTDAHRYSFTLSAPADDFVAVGKFSASGTGDDMGGTLVGFSSISQKRFFGIWGHGFIVGVSDGRVFWGSYWVDSSNDGGSARFELHNFGSEDVITGDYFIY
ncbi:MAG: hypothetical protein AABW68_04310 [archaeon]